MKQFTEKVSNTVLNRLIAHKFPYCESATYAEVLDWLKELGFFISIHETINQGFVIASFECKQCECSPHYRVGETLIKALDQIILMALDFIDE